MDYKHVNDDLRRVIVNNNLQSVEQEHAGTALALDMANRMVKKSAGNDELQSEYKRQAEQLQARLDSLGGQIEAWNEILKGIPTIAETELPHADQ